MNEWMETKASENPKIIFESMEVILINGINLRFLKSYTK